MSRTASTALKAHLAGEVTTLAHLWHITLTNSTVYTFTDHDLDIVYGGVTYLANSGFVGSDVETSSQLNVDNMEVQGMLVSPSVTEADLLVGLWDFAAISLYVVNYKDLTMGSMYIRSGTIGQVSVKRSQFIAELRGMTQPLQQTLLEYYSAGCRANLGDTRCAVSLGAFTFAGSVTTISSSRAWYDTALVQADLYFTNGLVTWLTGANTGLSMEVKIFTTGYVELFQPMPYTIVAADTYNIIAGCDKTLATCIAKFNNVINFRGEPHIPGVDAMMAHA